MGKLYPCPALEAVQADALHHPKQKWPSHDQTGHNQAGHNPLHAVETETTQDHFIVEDGQEFAGRHVVFDFWGASRLDDLELMESALRECVDTCGATLLHIHLHHFTPNGGISGVAVLAESHISVHTWPERNFAAFDVFMCGEAKPRLAVPVLEKAFNPDTVEVNEIRRGLVNGK